jgi:hypothetical protein
MKLHIKDRNDLIGSCKIRLKGAADFEKTLTAVIEARAKATSVTLTQQTLSRTISSF